ncbi:MAG: hypothetical protein U9Q85_00450 [Patescibacteria group bacterium]|nr:hypothetical protein [Patescibacteria group bacterium]
MNINTANDVHDLPLEQIGWHYYRNIKKKAMEQEFSWSGLWLSLSIAFFIVIFSTLSLSLLYNSLTGTNLNKLIIKNNVQIENRIKHLPIEIGGMQMERIEKSNLA